MTRPVPSPSRAPGVEHVVRGVDGVARLVDYMKDRLAAVPVTEIGDLITEGFVGVRARAAADWTTGRTESLVADGDLLHIDAGRLADLRERGRWNPPSDEPLAILLEDDDVLVVAKPAGVHVHPLGDRRERTLVGALVRHAGVRDDEPWARWRPHVVQRLDAVVSGLLAVAKHAAAKDALVRVQKKHALERTYLAVVRGVVADDRGSVRAPIGREPGRGWRRAIVTPEAGGRHAATNWTVIERLGDRTILEVRPETGRTHQIRVHLASLGHPIRGDDLYADEWRDGAPARLGDAAPRPIALHAWRLRFAHPRTGEAVEVECPPPGDFRRR